MQCRRGYGDEDGDEELPRLPAESMRRNLEAKADVTTAGRIAENTSLIMGLATLSRPIPPVATQKKVVPRR